MTNTLTFKIDPKNWCTFTSTPEKGGFLCQFFISNTAAEAVIHSQKEIYKNHELVLTLNPKEGR